MGQVGCEKKKEEREIVKKDWTDRQRNQKHTPQIIA
jgi:hypothetical protein